MKVACFYCCGGCRESGAEEGAMVEVDAFGDGWCIDDGVESGKSIVHSLRGCCVPWKIILPLWKMYSLSFSKRAVRATSHSCPIDNRELEARCGKTCVFLALGRSCGMSSSAVCVDFIVHLFGRRTLIPSLVTVIFVRGRSTCMC